MRAVRRRRVVVVIGRAEIVERDAAAGVRGQVREQVVHPHDGLGLGVLQHHRDARAGIAGIERDVRAARLQDPEQADDHRQRTLDVDANQIVGPNAFGGKPPRQPVRAAVQLAVRQAFFAEDDGHVVRRALDLRGESIRHAQRADQLGLGGIAARDLIAFGRGHPIQLAERKLDPGRERRQRLGETGHHRLGPGAAHLAGVVREQELELGLRVGEQGQRKVRLLDEINRALRERAPALGQQRSDAAFIEDDHAVEQRGRAAEVGRARHVRQRRELEVPERPVALA